MSIRAWACNADRRHPLAPGAELDSAAHRPRYSAAQPRPNGAPSARATDVAKTWRAKSQPAPLHPHARRCRRRLRAPRARRTPIRPLHRAEPAIGSMPLDGRGSPRTNRPTAAEARPAQRPAANAPRSTRPSIRDAASRSRPIPRRRGCSMSSPYFSRAFSPFVMSGRTVPAALVRPPPRGGRSFDCVFRSGGTHTRLRGPATSWPGTRQFHPRGWRAPTAACR